MSIYKRFEKYQRLNPCRICKCKNTCSNQCDKKRGFNRTVSETELNRAYEKLYSLNEE